MGNELEKDFKEYIKRIQKENTEDEQDTGHAKKISLKIINKLSKSICKLIFEDGGKGTGFFMMIPSKKKETFNFLITNFHNISEYDVNSHKNITIYIHNEKNQKIRLNDYERFIQCFEKPIDITIVQILDSDQIRKDIEFLNFDLNYLYGYNNYLKEDVLILQHPLGEDVNYAVGKIVSIDNFEFEHTVDTDYGSSGSPVILVKNSMVIGIHKKRNKYNKNNIGSFIGILFKYLNNDFNKNEKILNIIFKKDNGPSIYMKFLSNTTIKQVLDKYFEHYSNKDIKIFTFLYKRMILNSRIHETKTLEDIRKKMEMKSL